MTEQLNRTELKALMELPRWLSGKEYASNAGDAGLICQEDPLEKEMATHSSILAWEIPWTEKPGGLQSMGSQKRTTERLCLSLAGSCFTTEPQGKPHQ